MSDRSSMCLSPLCLLLLVGAAVAAPVSRQHAQQVARNWVADVVHHRGEWYGSAPPTLVDEGAWAAGDTVLAWVFRVAPRGYVVVSGRRELAPVAATSESAHLPTLEPGGFLDMLRGSLARRVRLAAAAEDAGDPFAAHPAWEHYLSDDGAFQTRLLLDPADLLGVGPLLATTWHQGSPYNSLCPQGDGARTYVGCTPLAAAQLLAYHQWPLWGVGQTSYWWAGDDGCGHTTPGDTLRADHSDTYEWSLMPRALGPGSLASECAAVAELCYEVALACRTDFGVCGSSASLSMARSALVNRFRFLSTSREVVRFRYSEAAWFGLIQVEIGARRPVLYSSIIHTMVCDGWRELGGVRQVHINYGWAGDSDNWYALDDIETSVNPAAERMIIGLVPNQATPAQVSPLSLALRPDRTVDLSWLVDGDPGTVGFYVWRGSSASDRARLHDEMLTGQTAYTWFDGDTGCGPRAYWLQAFAVDGQQTWIGPKYVPAIHVDPDPETSLAIAPNPANPRVEAIISLAAPGRVRAEVVDLAGRRLSLLLERDLPAGEHRFAWDGRDAGGRHVSSGTYLMRVDAGGSRCVRRFILAR